MITEDYCSYEVSKLLKEKGFDFSQATRVVTSDNDFYIIGSIAGVDMERTCTHQMAMKWLREKGIIISLSPTMNVLNAHNGYLVSIDRIVSGKLKYEQEFGLDTYEEAVEAAFKYSLENLIQ